MLYPGVPQEGGMMLNIDILLLFFDLCYLFKVLRGNDSKHLLLVIVNVYCQEYLLQNSNNVFLLKICRCHIKEHTNPINNFLRIVIAIWLFKPDKLLTRRVRLVLKEVPKQSYQN